MVSNVIIFNISLANNEGRSQENGVSHLILTGALHIVKRILLFLKRGLANYNTSRLHRFHALIELLLPCGFSLGLFRLALATCCGTRLALELGRPARCVGVLQRVGLLPCVQRNRSQRHNMYRRHAWAATADR